mgnify:CR=1 FL=1
MIIMANVIIYLGYSFTKQQQTSIYTSKYLKVLHRAKDHIFKKNGRMHRFPPPPRGFSFPPPPRAKDGLPFLSPEMFNKKFFTPDALNEVLNKYDLEVSTIPYFEVSNKGELQATDKEWKLYKYKGFRFFYFTARFEKLFIKDKIQQTAKSQYIIILSVLLNIVFLVFYIFLINKLRPLTQLKENILDFAKGNLDIDTSCKGYDEISEVSNEFNNAIIEIRNLTNSRNLFLRNIMHELKTPITKGLLISNMMEDSKFKDSLKKAFFRLEYLLREFARIEEFTSRNIKIHKEEFRIVDIIDHSLDILLSDIDAIELEVVDNIVAVVDFELFALTIKNLLDNAMKYGEDKPLVILKDNTIYIKSRGKQLSQDIQKYNKPFSRQYENSTDGLGLGLYIVNSILKAHNLQLKYNFENSINTFSIKL